MKDRLPLYPGRVKLVPVSGQENVYDMTRADQPTQQGDPLNKATLLKDATAALFGLGTDAVPDEAFAYLGKYAQHWWRRRLINGGTEYITPYIEGSSSSEDPAKYILYVYDSDAPGSITYPIQYSDGVTVGDDGKPTGLADPIKTVNLSYDNCLTEGNVLKGKFIVQRYEDKRFPSRSADKGIAFVPSTAVFDRLTKYGTESYVYTDYISIDITAKPKKGDWEYLQSSDDDAYPHSGESGGYEYEYIGVPFETMPHAPKMYSGMYVGTGVFGSENKNSLTFDHPPKMVIVLLGQSGAYLVSGTVFIYPQKTNRGIGSVSNSSHMQQISIEWDGNTIKWSSGSAEDQYNDANTEYYYFALCI